MASFLRTLTSSGLLLAGALAAQGDPPPATPYIPRDALSGMGHGLMVEAEPDLVRRIAGEQTARPAPFAAVGSSRPRYRIYGPGGVFPQAAAGDVRFDAISTGNDLLPTTEVGGQYRIGFDSSGTTPTGVPSWVNVVVSLDQSAPLAQGQPGLPGTPPRLRSGITTDISADLYSYWFEYNIGTGPQFIDQAYLVDGHEHLGLQASDDITAIDTFMNFLADSPPDGSIVRVDYELYFSVTPGSLAYLNAEGATRFHASVLPAHVTAATIFKTVWSPATASWGEITVEFLPSDLHAESEPEPTDIDAIAFDAQAQSSSGYLRTLLFSDKLPTVAPQGGVGTLPSQIRILVKDSTGVVAVHDAVNGDGTDLRNRIGIRDIDDVDAICNEDPENSLPALQAAPIEGQDTPIPVSFGMSVSKWFQQGRKAWFGIQVHNLDGLRQMLPVNARSGQLYLHSWTVDPNDVNQEPPGTGQYSIEALGTLDQFDDDFWINRPAPLTATGLVIALQVVYIPNAPAPEVVYSTWRMAVRF